MRFDDVVITFTQLPYCSIHLFQGQYSHTFLVLNEFDGIWCWYQFSEASDCLNDQNSMFTIQTFFSKVLYELCIFNGRPVLDYLKHTGLNVENITIPAFSSQMLNEQQELPGFHLTLFCCLLTNGSKTGNDMVTSRYNWNILDNLNYFTNHQQA